MFDNTTEHGGKPELPLSRLVGLTSCFLGIFFAYALQGVVVVPLFQSLGLSDAQTSYVMLVSPLAVVLVFPLVGAVSDECHSGCCAVSCGEHASFKPGARGRRRPFIVLGLVLQVSGLAGLAFAPDIGYMLGDPPPTLYTSTDADASSSAAVLRPVAVTLSVASYALVDMAAGLMQLPTRALLLDAAPPSQQVLGASLLAFFMSAGNALGYLAAAVPWHKVPLFAAFATTACPDACADYRAVFFLAILTDLSTAATACLSISELAVPPPDEDALLEGSQPERTKRCIATTTAPALSMFSYVRSMGTLTRRVLIVYFVSWLVWPLFVFYISSWEGEEVWAGDPHAAVGSDAHNAYDQGVEAASFGLFLYSVVSFLYSLLIPRVVSVTGVRLAWALPQLMHGVLFFLFVLIRNKVASIAMIALVGINLATMHVIPFVLIGEDAKPSERGVAISLINVCNAAPSLVFNALINPLLLSVFGSLVPAMLYGGVVMFVAGCLVAIVPPQVKHRNGQPHASTAINSVQ